MDNQRGTNARPVDGAVHVTTATLPTELTHIEPTRIDEQTQQGTAFIYTPTSYSRNLYTAIDPQTGFSHMSCAGSTQPGDGVAVRVVAGPSWKEKVIGYAKKTRGTMLRKVRI
jgi:hypothetical protein